MDRAQALTIRYGDIIQCGIWTLTVDHSDYRGNYHVPYFLCRAPYGYPWQTEFVKESYKSCTLLRRREDDHWVRRGTPRQALAFQSAYAQIRQAAQTCEHLRDHLHEAFGPVSDELHRLATLMEDVKTSFIRFEDYTTTGERDMYGNLL